MKCQSVRIWKCLFLNVLALSGCGGVSYQIEIVPEKDTVTRRLIIDNTTKDAETEEPAVADDERQRIEDAYSSSFVLNQEKRWEIESVFGLEMPNDVGGAGSLVYLDSPMGSVSYFSERFRGGWDIVGRLKEREHDIDEVIDLLGKWAISTFGDLEEGSRLKDWIDRTLRDDLKNLMLLAWNHRLASDLGNNVHSASLAAHAMQYLFERKYLTPSEIPEVSRRFQAGDAESLISWTFRRALDQSGIDLNTLPNNPFAQRIEDIAIADSLRAFLRDTHPYKELENDQHDESVDPLWLLAKPLWPELGKGPTKPALASVEVNLHTEVPPFETNGHYDNSTKRTHWQADLHGRHLPMFVYAAWAEPNKTFQTDQLGSVLLKDAELGRYVLWYLALNAAERQQWDELFQSDENPLQRKKNIADFAFEGNEGLAEIPKTLLAE